MSKILVGAVLLSSPAIAARIKTITDTDAYHRAASLETFAQSYPQCSKKLQSLGMQLEDLALSENDVRRLFTPSNSSDCLHPSVMFLAPDPSRTETDMSRGDDQVKYCADAHATQLTQDYFLRMTLVGQPDPRGPTLYTPEAQNKVIETMKEVGSAMLQSGKKNPDVPFLDKIFEGINVPDTGSFMADFGNFVAGIVNRGKGDTLYRSKDVQSKFYDLTKWGDDMHKKISEYNTLTYKNESGHEKKGLKLKSSRLLGGTSFKYKYPPKGIKHELQILVDTVGARQSSSNFTMFDTFDMAEKWIRDFVILHPYTDSNGRTARVAMNILLMLNGLSPAVMARQDEDMSSSPKELRDRICEGMAHAKSIFQSLPHLQSEIKGGPSTDAGEKLNTVARCCSANYKLERGADWCVSVPSNLQCARFAELTQSNRYLPWRESHSCNMVRLRPGTCKQHK